MALSFFLYQLLHVKLSLNSNMAALSDPAALLTLRSSTTTGHADLASAGDGT